MPRTLGVGEPVSEQPVDTGGAFLAPPCGPRLAEQRCGAPAVLRTPMMRNAKPSHRDEGSLHPKTFA